MKLNHCHGPCFMKHGIYQNEIDIYLDRWHTRMLNIKRNQSMFAYQFFLGLYKSHPINFLKGFRYV